MIWWVGKGNMSFKLEYFSYRYTLLLHVKFYRDTKREIRIMAEEHEQRKTYGGEVKHTLYLEGKRT
jgi:hypothetical protein